MSETRAVYFEDGFYGVARGEQVLHYHEPRRPARYSTLDNARRDVAKFNGHRDLNNYVWRRAAFKEIPA